MILKIKLNDVVDEPFCIGGGLDGKDMVVENNRTNCSINVPRQAT